MSVERDVTGQAIGDVVEAPYWAPPEAPLDMPVQALEVERPRRAARQSWRWLPGARA